jgi:hypothetical protein
LEADGEASIVIELVAGQELTIAGQADGPLLFELHDEAVRFDAPDPEAVVPILSGSLPRPDTGTIRFDAPTTGAYSVNLFTVDGAEVQGVLHLNAPEVWAETETAEDMTARRVRRTLNRALHALSSRPIVLMQPTDAQSSTAIAAEDDYRRSNPAAPNA